MSSNKSKPFIWSHRKPRIWLIGNKADLGWIRTAKSLEKDVFGIAWIDAIAYVKQLIYISSKVPFRLHDISIQNNIYTYEAQQPNKGSYSQGKFMASFMTDLRTRGRDIGRASFIRKYKPITNLSIPDLVSDERVAFSNAVKVFIAVREHYLGKMIKLQTTVAKTFGVGAPFFDDVIKK